MWGDTKLHLIPDSALEALPEIWEENTEAYQAWWDLNSERHQGFGEGVIPFAAIRAYAQEAELEVLELLRKIRAMDKAYLLHRQQKEEAKAQDAKRRERWGQRSRVHRER